ncbi:hypothetical protein F5Y19DRAFT_491805 [Xylariaceae sp. FL1651]|nr:hypothetical protein F5Y19DRAFT_491805 [Xylariaceae sp. FL1651]
MASQVIITKPTCANQASCNSRGSFVCASCRLVLYCSKTCQKAHWPQHKRSCKVLFTTATFETEYRLPSWAPHKLYADLVEKHVGTNSYSVPSVGPPGYKFNPSDVSHGDVSHTLPYGNFPAIDILRLDANEGAYTKKPVDVLFAQSRDLRNAIKTIVDLPENFSAPLRFVISHEDRLYTLRNIILLLMALSSNDPDATAECAVHFWYSPYLPQWCIPAMKDWIGTLVSDGAARGLAGTSLLENHWSFGSASLKAKLVRDDWKFIKNIIHTSGYSDSRFAGGIALSRGKNGYLDYAQRSMLSFPLAWRSGKIRYNATGRVAPFGHDFTGTANLPMRENPTFLYFPLSDPLQGWDVAEVNKNKDIGAAVDDIYGKLFYYVRDLFKKFIVRLRTLTISFEIFPYSSRELPKKLGGRFDRIETSDLAGIAKLGVYRVLRIFSPLLKPPSVNPHASILTLHRNVFTTVRDAWPCPLCDIDLPERIKRAVELTAGEKALLDMYLPLKDTHPVNWIFTSVGWQRRDAKWLFRDPEPAWELYKEIYDFESAAKAAKVTLKPNSIVSEWPFRSKLVVQLDDNGRPTPTAQMEFEIALAAGHTSGDRYVEWRKLTTLEKKKTAKSNHMSTRNHEEHELSLDGNQLMEMWEWVLESDHCSRMTTCKDWTPY